jgi:hypothetical protein
MGLPRRLYFVSFPRILCSSPNNCAVGLPPARFLARLHWYYEPLGRPPGFARVQPSGLIRPVFVRLDRQAGSLLFRILLWKRATALYPGKVQHSFWISRMLSIAFAAT